MAVDHPSPSTSTSTSTSTSANQDFTTKITDMDMDSLVHCTSSLSLQDLSNMAISSKFLNRVVYSDSIWRRLFRERWPHQELDSILRRSGAREAYLARYNALQQFKFVDPLVSEIYMGPKSSDVIYLSKDDMFFSQGPVLQIMNIDKFLTGKASLVSLIDHRARITSMRLFPMKDTSLFRNETQLNENVLVTSSCDHSIRLWWKGSCQRCFRGHNGPVTILSDKLLGDGSAKVFASGGEDSTVRLWSLTASGKRERALKATLYGHEKPIVLMSVTGHSASLVVSVSKDSKVRVWDAAISTSDRSSSCVGMMAVPGAPVSMKCHDSLLYIASGSSIGAVDLRTMRRVFNTATEQGKLSSFDIVPSKFLVCTGGVGRAMLWDIRRSTGTGEAEPVAELDGHTGPVTHLHMDPYKIVTGGWEDPYVNVWEVDSGKQTNSLICSSVDSVSGCCGMAVDGFRIVTASSKQDEGVLRFHDFNHASCSVSSNPRETISKFWGSLPSVDADDSDG